LDTVWADEVQVPTAISSSIGSSDWSQAVESGLCIFYDYNSGTKQLSLRSIDNWFLNLDFYEPEDLEYHFTFSDGSGLTDQFLIRSDVTTLFLGEAYPEQEIEMPISWEQIEIVGRNLLSGLTPYVNSYVITSTPFDSSLISVQSACANPQGTYGAPSEAFVHFRLGLPGVALSVGASWPPPLPS
jgi:hypothetical protein